MAEVGDFRGVTVAMVTPLGEDGSVDEGALRKHVDDLVESGVRVLLPCGTTGESATLRPEEQRRVIAVTVEAAEGRVAVMAGAGTNATADACDLARAAAAEGADAVLTVAPYYNKPTQEGLVQHFRAVRDAAGIPLFVYNVPGRTSVNIRAETTLRLAEADGVWGVKEASGDVAQIADILRGRPEGFLVLSGDDELTLPLLALGGDGVVSVVANEAPGLMSRLVAAGLEGDFETARRIHFRLLGLMRANFVETNPIPVKAAMERLGKFPAHYRLPLTPLGDAGGQVLDRALRTAGLLS